MTCGYKWPMAGKSKVEHLLVEPNATQHVCDREGPHEKHSCGACRTVRYPAPVFNFPCSYCPNEEFPSAQELALHVVRLGHGSMSFTDASEYAKKRGRKK